MPRPGPRRPAISLRLSDELIAAVDAKAEEFGVLNESDEPNRSEMIRQFIEYGLAKMPKPKEPARSR